VTGGPFLQVDDLSDETKHDEQERGTVGVVEDGGAATPVESEDAGVEAAGDEATDVEGADEEPADVDDADSGDVEAADTEMGGDVAPESGAADVGEAVGVYELVAADLVDVPPAPGSASRVADPQLKAIIEALVFASPEPLTAKTLFKLLESEPREDVELAIASLRADYEGRGGLQFVEVANGFQIVTRPEMHEWVRRLFHERKTQKLSVQALETLAVIAYKQPITAPEITEIRGVNTAGVLSTLIERHLLKIAGRKAVVGRPFLYATTREFLIRFGLRDLNDLPKVEDLADLLGFEPPAGLTESGPSALPLPLEADEPEPAATEAPAEAPPAGEPTGADAEEQVH
jgi:segregation and condensation protein B